MEVNSLASTRPSAAVLDSRIDVSCLFSSIASDMKNLNEGCFVVVTRMFGRFKWIYAIHCLQILKDV
uniref:Uncharacterized protein n=1 Tax=Arundo donax TaxID=35708 RepID=A0A0A9EJ94_ARUDO